MTNREAPDNVKARIPTKQPRRASGVALEFDDLTGARLVLPTPRKVVESGTGTE